MQYLNIFILVIITSSWYKKETRKSEVAYLNAELNQLIREGRQKCMNASSDLFKLKQEHERKIHEMKYELKQTELDSQYQVLQHACNM